MTHRVRTVNVQEAKTQLSRLLRAVEAGDEVVIARAGRVIARLVRADEAAPRRWGSMEGEVQADDDAFAALTDDEVSLWDGSLG